MGFLGWCTSSGCFGCSGLLVDRPAGVRTPATNFAGEARGEVAADGDDDHERKKERKKERK